MLRPRRLPRAGAPILGGRDKPGDDSYPLPGRESAVRKADESNAIGFPTFGFRDHPRPSRVNLPRNTPRGDPGETRTPIFNSIYGYDVRSVARLRDHFYFHVLVPAEGIEPPRPAYEARPLPQRISRHDAAGVNCANNLCLRGNHFERWRSLTENNFIPRWKPAPCWALPAEGPPYAKGRPA
jgi:hypothetical protein